MLLFHRVALLVALLFFLPSLLAAQNAYFLDIPEIPGEVDDAGYKDQICISSFSWGVTVAQFAGGGGVGNGEQEDFLMGKAFDVASTELYEAILMGTTFKEATLSLLKPNAQGQLTLVAEYEFKNFNILKLQPGADEDGSIKEVLGITAEIVTVSHYDASGNLTKEFGWNFLSNSPD